MRAHPPRQRRAGGAAVTVAHHKISMGFARKIGGVAGGNRRHRMAVDMNTVAVPRMRRINRLRHRCVIGLPALRNARLHFIDRQPALINRHAIVGRAPDQPLAQPHFREDAGIGFDRPRPGRVKQRNINFIRVPVGVQIAARKMRLNPVNAKRGREVIQLFHVRVFCAAQGRHVAGVQKIRRINDTTMGRVKNQCAAAGKVGDELHRPTLSAAFRPPALRVHGKNQGRQMKLFCIRRLL